MYNKIKNDVKAAKVGRVARLTGGSVHSDEPADRALVKTMVKPASLTGRKDGGKTKAKPKGGTKVNVIVAPRGQDRPVPVPVPVGGAAVPGPVPSRAPAQPPQSQPAPMRVVNVPPPQGPLGPLPAKRGGAIKKRADGGGVKFTAGAGTGKGRLEKADAQKGKGRK